MAVGHLNIWRHYLPDVCYANLYGPTEITDACTCYIVDRQFRDHEPLPIGKPISGVEILLVSEEDGVLRKTPEGDAGEICVTGVCLSPGYFRNPEASENAFTDDGFFRTGDLGIMDKDGNIFIKGRCKTMILSSSGQNIYPEEVEAVINSQDFVAESGVVDRASKLVALVYLDDASIKKFSMGCTFILGALVVLLLGSCKKADTHYVVKYQFDKATWWRWR